MNILITGANRGIGLELTRQYAHEPGNHIIACARTPKKADDLNQLATRHPQAVTIRQLDVTDAASIANLAHDIKDQQLDIVINNAGTMGGERQAAFDMDFDNWAQAFAINTMGPLRVIQAVRPALAPGAKLITISSQMGSLNRNSQGAFAYRSSKAAVNKVMQTLALELRDQNIIVCPLHPGWVRTDMGGPGADISVEESATGIRNVISSLTIQDTGRFYQWNGSEHPW